METLRILHLEDNPADAELVQATLADGELKCEIFQVDSRNAFLRALDERSFDLILSDFNVPGFDGKSALDIARRTHPDTPFIFVSGTIGEDAAIDSLTGGATDYVLKHKFSRLLPAIQRACRETHERRLRKEAEEKLALTLTQIRNIFDNLDDVFFSVDMMEQKVLQLSPACQQLTGVPASTFLEDMNLWEKHIHEDDRHIAADLYTQLKAGKSQSVEGRIVHSSGKIHWIEARLKPVFGAGGALERVDGVLIDVSERRSLQAQFLRAQRLESIGTLASGIAHDLNNILSPILMAVQVLKDQTAEEGGQRILNTLEGAALRGRDLVKQVLTFARGGEEQRGPLPLRHLVRDVESILTETFPKSIQIQTEIPRDLWTAHGDSTQLHQVLMNLCVNARDAMSSGGVLNISVQNVTLSASEALRLKGNPGDHIAIRVADTGEGIPADLAEKIFDAFFTTKASGKGTGLGLSTVQTLVQGHGGLINLESEVGCGTVFTVYLPAIQRTSAAGPRKRIEAIPRGNGQLVLIVDDEVAIRDIARIVLEAYGYRTVGANNGIDGLNSFKQHQDEVRVVLTDVSMPGMDGNQMVEGIRDLGSAVPVVFMTGVADTIEAPCTDNMSCRLDKPFTSEALLITMRDVLPAAAAASAR